MNQSSQHYRGNEMMDLPWVIGAACMLVFFTFFESYAFNHPTRVNSLSRSMFNLGSKFPLSIMFFGMLVGGLGVHFYWHWCPPGSNSYG
jgi:hypothetical protein